MNRLSEVFRSNLVDLLALPLALGLSVTALIVGLQREHWDAEDGARKSLRWRSRIGSSELIRVQSAVCPKPTSLATRGR